MGLESIGLKILKFCHTSTHETISSMQLDCECYHLYPYGRQRVEAVSCTEAKRGHGCSTAWNIPFRLVEQ